MSSRSATSPSSTWPLPQELFGGPPAKLERLRRWSLLRRLLVDGRCIEASTRAHERIGQADPKVATRVGFVALEIERHPIQPGCAVERQRLRGALRSGERLTSGEPRLATLEEVYRERLRVCLLRRFEGEGEAEMQILEVLRGHPSEQSLPDAILIELDLVVIRRAARADEMAQAKLVHDREIVPFDQCRLPYDAKLDRTAGDRQEVEQAPRLFRERRDTLDDDLVQQAPSDVVHTRP